MTLVRREAMSRIRTLPIFYDSLPRSGAEWEAHHQIGSEIVTVRPASLCISSSPLIC